MCGFGAAVNHAVNRTVNLSQPAVNHFSKACH
jgi:hypothetical protein